MSSVTEAVTTRATRPRVPIATRAAAATAAAAARATTANLATARTDPPDKGDTVINKVSFRFIFYFSSFALISLAC